MSKTLENKISVGPIVDDVPLHIKIDGYYIGFGMIGFPPKRIVSIRVEDRTGKHFKVIFEKSLEEKK